MRRLTRNALAVVAVALLAIMLTAPTSQADTVDVNIQGFAFNPTPLTITVGQVVRWTNNDAAQHTSTSDTPNWDSGLLNQGQSWSMQFNTAGTYPYHCSVHPTMLATLIVEPAPAVPGLSVYGVALLILLLSLAAFFVIRRKNSAVPT